MIYLKMVQHSVKGKLKDYLILFSGLIIATSIFFMFQVLASNNNLTGFLKNTVEFKLIFKIGTFLLSIIIFIYLLYANSFFMDLKRKTSALFMFMGATKRQIGFLIFVETFFIGIISTVIGVILGVALSAVSNQLLLDALSIPIEATSIYSTTALVVTSMFFLFSFILVSTINTRKLLKESLINLMKQKDTPENVQRNRLFISFECLAGIVLLFFGYWLMSQTHIYKIQAIVGAAVTTVMGSYMLIRSLTILILGTLRKNATYSLRKLNQVFLAQMMYRIKEYTQILSITSILFALALGALTVGFIFKTESYNIADKTLYYDLVINDKERVAPNLFDDLTIVNEVTYSVKEDGTHVYFDVNEFEKQPLFSNSSIDSKGGIVISQYDGSKTNNKEIGILSLKNLLNYDQKEKNIDILSDLEFKKITGNNYKLSLIKTNDFKSNIKQIKRVVDFLVQEKSVSNNPIEYSRSNQKYQRYAAFNTALVGFQYMGFFLGIAFLAMLLSCLMFKILSSVSTDRNRYIALNKIGVSQVKIKSIVGKELFYIFLIPGFLGTTHMLFGLQMFRVIFVNPYKNIVMPITLFITLYSIYFFVCFYTYIKLLFKYQDNNSM